MKIHFHTREQARQFARMGTGWKIRKLATPWHGTHRWVAVKAT